MNDDSYALAERCWESAAKLVLGLSFGLLFTVSAVREFTTPEGPAMPGWLWGAVAWGAVLGVVLLVERGLVRR